MSKSTTDAPEPKKNAKREDEVYYIVYHCSNCGKNEEKRIARGTIAPNKTHCYNCGCDTAMKVMR